MLKDEYRRKHAKEYIGFCTGILYTRRIQEDPGHIGRWE
jgi:hypothetical protein